SPAPAAGPGPRLREAIKDRADKTVYLKADQGLTYGFVVETMDRIRRAGVEKLAMVTEPAGDRCSRPASPESSPCHRRSKCLAAGSGQRYAAGGSRWRRSPSRRWCMWS